jgi:hypothetical protein
MELVYLSSLYVSYSSVCCLIVTCFMSFALFCVLLLVSLKEEALDRIKWRNRFGRGCGPVV